MTPLAGVHFLDVAMYGFVPSAGAVRDEWGAAVIKVDPALTGDPHEKGRWCCRLDPRPLLLG